MMPSKNSVREAYRASIRHALGPTQIEEYPDGLLLLDEKGKIAACGSYEKIFPRLPRECPVRDHRGSWILPGFVDCHVHLPQLDCRNKNGLTLLDWLATYIYPAEEKFSDPKVASDTALRFFDELLSHGTTTASIYSTVHFEATDIAFQIAQDKGIRAIIGQALMDQNASSALLRPKLQLLRESEKLILKWEGKGKRLFFSVSPRFALTCSKDLLREAGRLAKEAKVRFQTHMAETKEEVTQVRELYHFKNYPAFYEALGCLGPDSLFAHAIYLDDAEWSLLSGYKCCVVHCPTSNVFLKSGTMPFKKVEAYGLRCGLGTDVGGGPTFSMREVMDCAESVHPREVMDKNKSFYLATLGGAKALSLDNLIGNFVEGKWGDFSIFDNPQMRGKPKMVFVSGQCVCKNL